MESLRQQVERLDADVECTRETIDAIIDLNSAPAYSSPLPLSLMSYASPASEHTIECKAFNSDSE